MNESKFAAVSSAIDDELSNEQDLNTIINDESLTDCWQRYQLVGDVLRNEVPDHIQLDLSRQVSEALAGDVTVLAPTASASLAETMKAKIIQFAKPVGQMAIAASAAGLMILGVQQNNAELDMGAPSQVVQTSPLAGVVAPVSFNVSSEQQRTTAQQRAEQARLQQQRRFQSLLSDHQQQLKFSARREQLTSTDVSGK